MDVDMNTKFTVTRGQLVSLCQSGEAIRRAMMEVCQSAESRDSQIVVETFAKVVPVVQQSIKAQVATLDQICDDNGLAPDELKS